MTRSRPSSPVDACANGTRRHPRRSRSAQNGGGGRGSSAAPTPSSPAMRRIQPTNFVRQAATQLVPNGAPLAAGRDDQPARPDQFPSSIASSASLPPCPCGALPPVSRRGRLWSRSRGTADLLWLPAQCPEHPLRSDHDVQPGITPVAPSRFASRDPTPNRSRMRGRRWYRIETTFGQLAERFAGKQFGLTISGLCAATACARC